MIFQPLRQLRNSWGVHSRRLFTSANYDPSLVRNLALVAHIDSGKTTLTESILLSSSYISSSGSVDTGSTITDFLPAERERGITIQSASIPVHWNDWTFNLIDTPGHADFGMEVESASRVVDGAVVLIDSVEGVEAQTKGVWSQLDRYNVPTRIVFLNKLDRPGASFRSSLLSLISHRLHPNPMALTIPISSHDPQDYKQATPGIQGLVDLVHWEIWMWGKNGTPSRHPLPRNNEDLAGMEILPHSHPIISHLVPARTALLENLSMFSEEFMDFLLSSSSASYLNIDTSTILYHLRTATLRNEILPVLCGSATRHIGTELTMDYIGKLLASPLDVEKNGQLINQPLRLLAWKVCWDKKRGWMTFVRVYAGTLTRQTALLNTTRNQRERVSKLLLLYASEAKEVHELPFGSVGVILGLKHTRTGDTLVSPSSASSIKMPSSLQDIRPPSAVISASVIPRSHSDLEPVQEALKSLTRTDPSVRVETQEGQLLVHGLGALHLEIVEGRLRDEWEARFEFGRRRVSYREGLGCVVQETTSDSWQIDLAGKQVTVQLSLSVRPMTDRESGDPNWDGNILVDNENTPLPTPSASADALSPLASIARGISSSLSQSPHTSLPMSNIHVRVNSFSYPLNAPSVLAGASAAIMRNHIRDAGIGPVMEPYVRLKITINEDSLGKVIKDLTENGGEMEDVESECAPAGDGADDLERFTKKGGYVPPDWLSPSSSSSLTKSASGSRLRRSIHAVAPLSKMLDYSSRLRALSGGHGVFEMANIGFKVVSEARTLEILKEIGRA